MLHIDLQGTHYEIEMCIRDSRNTARYCLGNLDGFDPNELVKPEEMLELDRWAVTKLNELTEKCFAAYDNYEFHVVSHAINDFCVVELSSFYLDIIKDRLYCEETDGLERPVSYTHLDVYKRQVRMLAKSLFLIPKHSFSVI